AVALRFFLRRLLAAFIRLFLRQFHVFVAGNSLRIRRARQGGEITGSFRGLGMFFLFKENIRCPGVQHPRAKEQDQSDQPVYGESSPPSCHSTGAPGWQWSVEAVMQRCTLPSFEFPISCNTYFQYYLVHSTTLELQV